MRLKLTIAYDGRPYNGWQSQVGGNTVQDIIQCALEEVAKQPLRLHGSGRTDTGVHALAQIAHFDAPPGTSMNPFNWVPALNCKLPATIRIMACEEVAPDFHSRFSAIGKIYHFDLCTDPVLPPLKAGLAWHLPRQLDADVLWQALSLFLGRHDFHAFAAYRGNRVFFQIGLVDRTLGGEVLFIFAPFATDARSSASASRKTICEAECKRISSATHSSIDSLANRPRALGRE